MLAGAAALDLLTSLGWLAVYAAALVASGAAWLVRIVGLLQAWR